MHLVGTWLPVCNVVCNCKTSSMLLCGYSNAQRHLEIIRLLLLPVDLQAAQAVPNQKPVSASCNLQQKSAFMEVPSVLSAFSWLFVSIFSEKNDCCQNTTAGNLINSNSVIGDSWWGSYVHVSKRNPRPRVPNIIFTEGRPQRQKEPHQRMAKCPEGMLPERSLFLWFILVSSRYSPWTFMNLIFHFRERMLSMFGTRNSLMRWMWKPQTASWVNRLFNKRLNINHTAIKMMVLYSCNNNKVTWGMLLELNNKVVAD